MITANFAPGTDAWEERESFKIYAGEVIQARAEIELPDHPWMAGSVTDGTPEPKVLEASIVDGVLTVSLAHYQFDPNIEEEPIVVTGLRVYKDPSFREPRPR